MKAQYTHFTVEDFEPRSTDVAQSHSLNVMPAEAGTHDTLKCWCAFEMANTWKLAWMAACAAMTV